MQAEMDALESRIAQLIERHQAMGEENVKLRQQIVALESQNKQLMDRLDEARVRMQALHDQLPD